MWFNKQMEFGWVKVWEICGSLDVIEIIGVSI